MASLAITLAARGEAQQAGHLAREAITVLETTGPVLGLALAVEAAAAAAAAGGDGELAARLLGWVAATRTRHGAPLVRAERADVDRIESAARGLVGDAVVDHALVTSATADLRNLLVTSRTPS
jgi:hypothetical protein